MIAEVIINRTAKKLNRIFDYKIPDKLKDLIFIGSKVLVPFGNGGKLEEAFVIGIKPKSAYEVNNAFQTSMSNVQALSGATGADLEKLTSLAREMGATTQFSARRKLAH